VFKSLVRVRVEVTIEINAKNGLVGNTLWQDYMSVTSNQKNFYGSSKSKKVFL
jgi:hypothetical protein